MSEQNKNVPRLRFPGFTDAWVECSFLESIKDIIDFRGRTPKKLGKDWSDTGYLALSALNVKNGYINPDADAHYGNQELYDMWMTGKELHKNQVLFTTEAPMGNVAQVPNNNKYILSQRVIAFDVYEDKITEDFLATILRSPKTFDELSALSSGGTAKGVSQKSLAGLKIVIPNSLNEQNKISSYIKLFDKTIDLYHKELNKLKNLKKAYLDKMFPKNGSDIPELRFPGYTDAWVKCELGELGKIITGSTPSTLNSSNWTNDKNEYVWITPTDINRLDISDSERHLSEDGWRIARIIPANSVLITSIASIGKNAINTVQASFNQQINAIVPEDNDAYFILSAMEKDSAKFASIAGQTATAIINKTEFMKFSLTLPTFEEQTKIGKFFKHLDNLITVNERELKKIKELKKSYLKDMFV